MVRGSDARQDLAQVLVLYRHETCRGTLIAAHDPFRELEQCPPAPLSPLFRCK